MANEDKISIIDEQPVMRSLGIKYVRVYAGPSDATKPKDNLANGSIYIKTDVSPVESVWFDEVTDKWGDEE
jgi:hypothetical protein